MKIHIPILLVLSILISVSAIAFAITYGNLEVRLVREPMAFDPDGRIYTPYCLNCHLPLLIKWDGSDINLLRSELKTYKTQIEGLDDINSIHVEYLHNVSYQESICDKVWNASNSSYYSDCHLQDAWRGEWRALPSTIPIKSGKWYMIDIIGYREPSTAFSAIDLVPEIKGILFPEFAWWNSSYSYCRNLTNNSFAPSGFDGYFLWESTGNEQADFDDVVFADTYCDNGGSAISQLRTYYNATDAQYLFSIGSWPKSIYYGYALDSGNHDDPTGLYGASIASVWGFDEGTGAVAYDDAGSVDCALTDAPAWAAGRKGRGLDFERSNFNYLDCGDNNDASSALTLCAWVKPESCPAATNEGAVISKGESAGVGSYQLHLYANCQVKGNVRAGSWCSGAFSTREIPTGSWSFICMTFDGSTIRNYINGTADGTNSCSGTIDNSASELLIGAFLATTHNFDGIIDQPMIWVNDALDAGEIAAFYTATEPTFSRGAEQTSGTYPQWSNNQSSYPNPYENINSVFNTTWYNLTAGSIVYWESNYSGSAQNYSMTNATAFVYNYTLSLPAGLHYWKSYANNTQGWNETDSWIISIANASNPISLIGYNSTSSYPVSANYTPCAWLSWCFGLEPAGLWVNETYPNPLKASWSCSAGSTTIERNNVSISGENNTWILLAANEANPYYYELQCLGNQNYTANYSFLGMVEKKGTPLINITSNGSDTISAGDVVQLSCNKPSQLTIDFSNDTGSISNPYVLDSTGLLGLYNYSCSNSTGNENYTAGNDDYQLIVVGSSGLSVNVFDEENITQALTFNITINNGTMSNTAYDQTNPYTNASLIGITTIDISSSGYQPRSYYRTLGDDIIEVNATLLADGSGSWILFYVLDSEESPIGSALLEVERLYAPDDYIVIAEKKTDDAGTASIYLDTTTTYRINASAAGYYNQSKTIQPSASPYVFTLLSDNDYINYSSLIENIIYQILPSGSGLSTQEYDFSFYVNSTDEELEWAGLNITFWNGSSLYYNNTSVSDYITFTKTLDMSIWDNTTLLQAFFKKDGYDPYYINKTYYIWPVNYSNSSLQAAIEDIKAGSIDVDSTGWLMISLIVSVVIMGAAGSQFKIFGAGIFGIISMAAFTLAGTYIWGAGYLIGWPVLILMTLGIAALLYIRRG